MVQVCTVGLAAQANAQSALGGLGGGLGALPPLGGVPAEAINLLL